MPLQLHCVADTNNYCCRLPTWKANRSQWQEKFNFIFTFRLSLALGGSIEVAASIQLDVKPADRREVGLELVGENVCVEGEGEREKERECKSNSL